MSGDESLLRIVQAACPEAIPPIEAMLSRAFDREPVSEAIPPIEAMLSEAFDREPVSEAIPPIEAMLSEAFDRNPVSAMLDEAFRTRGSQAL